MVPHQSSECPFSKCSFRGADESKKPWGVFFTLPPCGNRCRCSEIALFFSRRAPPSTKEVNKKVQTVRGVCQDVVYIVRNPAASIKGRQTGGFQTGGFPDLDLSFLFCPFLSLLGLSRFFWDFPDLSGDSSGIFPICPFPLSRPINSASEEQSRKGPRHNLDLSRKSGKPPGLETPGLASPKVLCME